MYNAINLAVKGGVVVVAANYRVDVLGWIALMELALEANGAYGNYGLQDQTFALKWTRDNVHAFGGDPLQVTIFGESAGAFSVCQHLTMPASNALFSRAIIQSGDCSGPWLIQDGANAQAFGDTYATMIGCAKREGAAGARERLECLRAKSSQDVMEPYTKWFCPPHIKRPDDPWCGNNTLFANAAHSAGFEGAVKPWPDGTPPLAPICGWTAVIDGSDVGLPASPFDRILSGDVNRGPRGEKISVVMGTNEDEMALFMIAVRLSPFFFNYR